MTTPPYHLRPNKAADRFAWIEAIRRLQFLGSGGLENYKYFGMGGPYLEEFRLLYEFFPEVRMTSIEEHEEVYKRQMFHRPFRTLKLERDDLSSFISRYDPGQDKSIFWLDYTHLKYRCFQDFMNLLAIVTENSMIKITLRSNPTDFWDRHSDSPRERKQDQFRQEFRAILPDPSDAPPRLSKEFASLLQEMLRVAAQKILHPGASHRAFMPVSSFYYSDGAHMFTLTGIVCNVGNEESVKTAFDNWDFSNLEWESPTKISVPVLSTKERLHLQNFLPAKSAQGSKLHRRLGYRIEDGLTATEKALEQYAAFHRHAPFFVRGTP